MTWGSSMLIFQGCNQWTIRWSWWTSVSPSQPGGVFCRLRWASTAVTALKLKRINPKNGPGKKLKTHQFVWFIFGKPYYTCELKIQGFGDLFLFTWLEVLLDDFYYFLHILCQSVKAWGLTAFFFRRRKHHDAGPENSRGFVSLHFWRMQSWKVKV